MNIRGVQSRPAFIKRQLIGALSLSRSDLQTRLAQASEAAYWRALYPPFSVCDDFATVPDIPALNSDRLDVLGKSFASYGYFSAESTLPASVIEPILECVEAVREAGWPPVFVYVYDQLWQIWRVRPIEQLLTAGLGAGYRWIRHGWCHYVHPVRGASGWPPHIDGDMSNRMSIWMPLTNSTLDNGCIYIVADDMNTSGVGWRRKLSRASNLQMRELLQRGRAVPAPAGSLLGWHFRILHWGSVCHAPGSARVSLVMEFVGAGEHPLRSEIPLYDPRDRLPGLPQRLHAIGRAILQYKRFELRMRRYVGLAYKLMAQSPI